MKNKVVLITGCSRGIGRTMVECFAKEGAIVYANARVKGSLDHYTEELSKKFTTVVTPVYFDVTDKVAAKEAIMTIKKQSGRLDVLVNNAGIMKDALLDMVDDETMEKTFSTNVFAVIHMTQLAIRLMKRQKSGCIINLSSIVGLNGNSGQTVYSASKGAVAALTKTWAKELISSGIRVNAIAPGKIDTDMFHSIGEERVKESLKGIGLGRLGTPEEVAMAAVLLASDKSSYITGEILGVNGGLSL